MKRAICSFARAQATVQTTKNSLGEIRMAQFTNPLDTISIAAPCSADWHGMTGDERVRFCGDCQKNVYNLSDMTRREAEQLISRTQGKLCVRYYRRADGSILTANCPIGLRALKRQMSRAATAVASAILSFVTGLGIYTSFGKSVYNAPLQGEYATTGMLAAPTPPSTPRNQNDNREARMGDVVMGTPDAPAPPKPLTGKVASQRVNKSVRGNRPKS